MFILHKNIGKYNEKCVGVFSSIEKLNDYIKSDTDKRVRYQIEKCDSDPVYKDESYYDGEICGSNESILKYHKKV